MPEIYNRGRNIPNRLWGLGAYLHNSSEMIGNSLPGIALALINICNLVPSLQSETLIKINQTTWCPSQSTMHSDWSSSSFHLFFPSQFDHNLLSTCLCKLIRPACLAPVRLYAILINVAAATEYVIKVFCLSSRHNSFDLCLQPSCC